MSRRVRDRDGWMETGRDLLRADCSYKLKKHQHRMHLLGFLLLAFAAVSCCQAEPNCTGYISELTVNIACTNLVDLTPLTAELATTEKPLHELIISNSSRLTLKREDIDTPRLLDIVELDLSDNGWTSFNSEPLQVLTKLEELKLSHNNLTAITANTFAGLESLTQLSLDNNLIETIDPAAFQSLTKLTYLDLDHNLISTIPAGLFSGVPLQTIQLRENVLTSIDADIFNNVPSLVNLVLSFNMISTIDSRAFQNLSVLAQVKLDFNELERLDSRLFENNPIVGLDLRNNKLKDLSKLPLNSTYFTRLILWDCNITHRDKHRKLFIRINDNPWDCNSPYMIELRALCEQRAVDFDQVFGCTE